MKALLKGKKIEICLVVVGIVAYVLAGKQMLEMFLEHSEDLQLVWNLAIVGSFFLLAAPVVFLLKAYISCLLNRETS